MGRILTNKTVVFSINHYVGVKWSLSCGSHITISEPSCVRPSFVMSFKSKSAMRSSEPSHWKFTVSASWWRCEKKWSASQDTKHSSYGWCNCGLMLDELLVICGLIMGHLLNLWVHHRFGWEILVVFLIIPILEYEITPHLDLLPIYCFQ